MKRIKFFSLVCALVLPAMGCAFGTDYVHINNYTPKTSGNSGSGMVVYVAKAQDNRSEPQYVGQKTAGYVALEKELNLSRIVTGSVIACLESEGYKVENPPAPGAAAMNVPNIRVLNTSIDDLWTTPVSGFWTVDANANAKLTFELNDTTGRTAWKKVIGKGDVESSAVGWTPGLFEDSLNGALGKVMDSFRSDIARSDFKNALLQGAVVPAGQPVTAPAAPAAAAPAAPAAPAAAAPASVPAQAAPAQAAPAVSGQTVTASIYVVRNWPSKAFTAKIFATPDGGSLTVFYLKPGATVQDAKGNAITADSISKGSRVQISYESKKVGGMFGNTEAKMATAVKVLGR